jgi:hypothetical protein
MTPRTAAPTSQPQPPGLEPEVQPTPDLEPHATVTRQQEMEALRRVQAQAEQRVQLGLKLFRAAETQVFSYQHLLDRVKSHQQELRQRVKQDMADSLRQYDTRVGDVEDKVTSTLAQLEQRMSQLNHDWSEARQRLEAMMRRTEALLEHSRMLLEAADQRLSRWPRSLADQKPLAATPDDLPLELLNPQRLEAEARQDQPDPVDDEPQRPAMPEPQIVTSSIAQILETVKRRTQQIMSNSPQASAASPAVLHEPTPASASVPVVHTIPPADRATPAKVALNHDEPGDESADQTEAARAELYRRVLEQLQARRNAAINK